MPAAARRNCELTPRRIAACVLVAPVLTAVAWIFPGPPIYDGIGFPDEPYRYVVAPSGSPATRPPPGAMVQFRVSGGANAGSVTAYTAEQGPQALVLLTKLSVVVPHGGPVATLSISPRAPHSSAPDGVIVGNAYAVSIAAGRNAGVLRQGAAAYIQLRVPQGIGPPVVLHVNNGGQWQALATNRTGNDTYNARLPVLGEVAAVQMTNAAAAREYSATQDPGHEPELLAISASVIGAAVVVLVIRRRSRPLASP